MILALSATTHTYKGENRSSEPDDLQQQKGLEN
jgi:hypothetical protein